MAKKILLIGASIGREWNISQLSNRTGNKDFFFDYISGGSHFDKSTVFYNVINNTSNKLDAIILKECAAYFPGDIEKYLLLIKKWINESKQRGLLLIPATVIPITRYHQIKLIIYHRLTRKKDMFTLNDLFNQFKINSIIEYNTSLRKYFEENNIKYLDFEKVLKNNNNIYLNREYARIDGLHLNRKGYDLLDNYLIQTLKGFKF